MFMTVQNETPRTLEIMSVSGELIIHIILFSSHLGCASMRTLGVDRLMITSYHTAENEANNWTLGAGELAQQVTCLTCNLEDQSSDPQHPCKKLDMAVSVISVLWGCLPRVQLNQREILSQKIRWRVTDRLDLDPRHPHVPKHLGICNWNLTHEHIHL